MGECGGRDTHIIVEPVVDPISVIPDISDMDILGRDGSVREYPRARSAVDGWGELEGL